MREQPLKHGSRIRIKICGLTRPEDIQAVNQAKPDFAGFIVEFPKSRRNVTVEQLKALREELESMKRVVAGKEISIYDKLF